MNKIGVKVLVNFLTVFRCFFTFAMPFLFDKISYTTFIYIVIALYATDWFDGFLARKFGVQTLFGSIMDTIADKVLCIILIVCIPNKHWSLFAMMIGEMMIGIMNLLRSTKWSFSNINYDWKSKNVGACCCNSFWIYALL